MDSHMWPGGSSDSGTSPGTPSRRKGRGQSRMGHTPAHDPLLELMMTALQERQRAESENGGTTTKLCIQQLPVSVSAQPPLAGGVSCGPQNSEPGAGHSSCCCRLWQRLWFKLLLLGLVVVAVVLAVAIPLGLQFAAGSGAAPAKRQMQPPQGSLGPRLDTSGYSLVWGEDFTFFDGATWNVEIGDGSDYGLVGWGNQELQCYTASPNNVDVIPNPAYPDDDGVLRIRPVYNPGSPQPCVNLRTPNSTRAWTSGKLDTKGKLAFTWAGQQVFAGSATTAQTAGRRRALAAAAPDSTSPCSSTNNSSSTTGVGNTTAGSACGSLVVEARVVVPLAAGRWSALWMMPRPAPCPAGGQPGQECGAFGLWPRSGEIDIVEAVNTQPQVMSTVHYANSFEAHGWSSGSLDVPPQELQDNWAIYQLVWDCASLSFYINGQQVHQVLKERLAVAVWPFDEPFFLILNTAIGGWLTSGVAPDTASAAPFLVDYVRVYGKPGG